MNDGAAVTHLKDSKKIGLIQAFSGKLPQAHVIWIIMPFRNPVKTLDPIVSVNRISSQLTFLIH